LLAESSQVLAVADALESTNGCKNVFHGGGAKTGEENNAEGDEIGIIVTDAILAGLRAVVAEVEEFMCVFSSFGDKGLGEKDESEEVKREA
jgi:hypothetical protein